MKRTKLWQQESPSASPFLVPQYSHPVSPGWVLFLKINHWVGLLHFSPHHNLLWEPPTANPPGIPGQCLVCLACSMQHPAIRSCAKGGRGICSLLIPELRGFISQQCWLWGPTCWCISFIWEWRHTGQLCLKAPACAVKQTLLALMRTWVTESQNPLNWETLTEIIESAPGPAQDSPQNPTMCLKSVIQTLLELWQFGVVTTARGSLLSAQPPSGGRIQPKPPLTPLHEQLVWIKPISSELHPSDTYLHTHLVLWELRCNLLSLLSKPFWYITKINKEQSPVHRPKILYLL